MPEKKMKSEYKIVQFSADGKKIRCVPMALQDGYSVGDRLLEGVMFEVTVPNGKIVVKATEDAKGYLEHVCFSIKKWEKEVLKYVDVAGDTLELEGEDPDWDTSELHLTDNLSFYTEKQGLILVESE